MRKTSTASHVLLDARTAIALERLAGKRGASKSAVLRDAVEALARREHRNEPARAWERAKDLIGCVKGGDPERSTRTGECFRRIIAARTSRHGRAS